MSYDGIPIQNGSIIIVVNFLTLAINNLEEFKKYAMLSLLLLLHYQKSTD